MWNKAKKGITGMKAGCKVKICGITCVEDRQLAAAAGADYFGVVIQTAFSPRSLTIDAAVELFTSPPIPGVALVYNPELQQLHLLVKRCQPYAIQFLSPIPFAWLEELKADYPALTCWQSLHLPPAGAEGSVPPESEWASRINDLAEAGVDVVVVDTVATIRGQTRYGGTGQVSDWALVQSMAQLARVPVFLAGGITPANVRTALTVVQPSGIDLCSGVEAAPGHKDPAKVHELIRLVREWERGGTV